MAKFILVLWWVFKSIFSALHKALRAAMIWSYKLGVGGDAGWALTGPLTELAEGHKMWLHASPAPRHDAIGCCFQTGWKEKLFFVIFFLPGKLGMFQCIAAYCWCCSVIAVWESPILPLFSCSFFRRAILYSKVHEENSNFPDTACNAWEQFAISVSPLHRILTIDDSASHQGCSGILGKLHMQIYIFYLILSTPSMLSIQTSAGTQRQSHNRLNSFYLYRNHISKQELPPGV